MPFLHTMIKYAADRGGLAGRVADVGLRAMKKRCVAVLTAALCLMLVSIFGKSAISVRKTSGKIGRAHV